jgi:hypothetical protein
MTRTEVKNVKNLKTLNQVLFSLILYTEKKNFSEFLNPEILE